MGQIGFIWIVGSCLLSGLPSYNGADHVTSAIAKVSLKR